MADRDRPLRVLYSFPHKLGAGRICYTAWQQVRGLALAGAEVLVYSGSVHKPVIHPAVTTRLTLARGRLRIPYRLLGIMRACMLHDWITARRLERLQGKIDIVHVWPLGGLETMKTAKRLGIPTVTERPNTHTAYAYEVVRLECERLGVSLPPGGEHSFDADALARERLEYEAADALLCPSDFVVKTFMDEGLSPEKLVRHQYGFDPELYYPASRSSRTESGLTILFAGYCAVRKGLHFALEAWLKSPAHHNGKFLIAGDFLPAYAEKLAPMLSHPSVHVLGHRNDIPELMRNSDAMILPSIEEGFGLVCVEALGSGSVPIVSDACTEICKHEENALVHKVGDVESLSHHITMLHENRELLGRLRQNAIASASSATWDAAGVKLLEQYRNVVTNHKSARTSGHTSASRYQPILESA